MAFVRALVALAALASLAWAMEAQQLDFSDGAQDDVDKMIKGLVTAVKAGDSSVFGGAKATVMSNNNVLNHKEAPKTDPLAVMAQTREEGRKADAEEDMKTRMEQKQKRLENHSKKRVQDKKLKMREASIKQEAEEDQKTANEENKKFREVSSKKRFEEKNKAAVARARKKAAYEQKKAILDLDSAKAKGEQQRLLLKQQAAKALALAAAAAQKVRAKTKENEDRALAIERQQKKRLAAKTKLLIERKRAEQLKKLEKRRKALGTYCGCQEKTVDFKMSNTWASCPAGTLLAGVYRNHDASTSGLTSLYCCKPCRDDGSSAMSVVQCAVSSWYAAMKSSATGWASCPDNSFLQGFYKGGCTSLQCVEQVKCCFIEGSKGMSKCKNTESGLQSVGWTRARKNAFLSGFKKEAGSHLTSLTAAKQCRYFAFP